MDVAVIEECKIMVSSEELIATTCRSLFKKIRDFTYYMLIYIFINELYFKQSRQFSNKFFYTQYRHQQ
jgi:hypothetical protein